MKGKINTERSCEYIDSVRMQGKRFRKRADASRND